MTTPRRRIAVGGTSQTDLRARVPASTEGDAERAMLRALHRSGVGGVSGLTALTAAGQLLAAVRGPEPLSHADVHVVCGSTTVHVEIDITGLDGFDETAMQSDAFPATRWGTLRERGRAALWADVDRSIGDRVRHDPDDPGAAADPIEVLLDVTTRLARARTLSEVAGVINGPLCAHLGANAAALAMREAGSVRLIDPGPSDYLYRVDVDHPREFPISSDLPIASAIRNAEFGVHPRAVLDHNFTAVGARPRGDNNDALTIVPVTIAGRPIGALAVGWRGTRPVEWLRPLLVIVANHSAEAAIRVLSPPPGVTTMRPAGPRAPGTQDRTATALGGLTIDVVSRRVFLPGREPVRLTGREFELLLFLGEHVGTVQSRLQTLREVWGIGFRADTSVVDVTVSRLRRKLGAEVIVTIRDQGYMLLA